MSWKMAVFKWRPELSFSFFWEYLFLKQQYIMLLCICMTELVSGNSTFKNNLSQVHQYTAPFIINV